MEVYRGTQEIKQLEKRKGGYYHLTLPAEIVNQFEHKKATRLICGLDDWVSFRCGLNHLGDGNLYVIVATKQLDTLGKQLGDKVDFEITIDPDQLGVEMPEALQVLLDQDPALKQVFDKITNGKKRSLIYSINKVKDIDKQVKQIIDFLNQESLKLK
ncbi:MAG: YdeI/OmpD-associated family protein [Bacteroidota bacterium]